MTRITRFGTLAATLVLTLILAGCPSTPPDDPGTACVTDADCLALDEDSDRCNGSLRCDGGACVATPEVECPTGDPCATSACAPETGACEVSLAPDGTDCSDGDPCTVDDACLSGACPGGSPACPDGDNPCRTATCDPESGECATVPGDDFEPCDDVDACTLDDLCVGGECIGTPRVCEDGDESPCTAASCVAGECADVAGNDGADCENPDPCLVSGSCAGGICSGGTGKCEGLGNACETAICLENGVCEVVIKGDGVACDDSDACTVNELCIAGECVDGLPKCTENEDPCLVTTCEVGTGACINEPVPVDPPVACDDTDPCTQGDACFGGLCLGTAIVCAGSDDGCKVGECDGGSCVLTTLEDGDSCANSNLCTVDTCLAGFCVSAPLCTDTDENTCTKEKCNPEDGTCSTTDLPDGFGCDDSDPCTTLDTCLDLECQGGEPTVCPEDGDPCTQELCLSPQGCISVGAPDGATCDDSDACTADETCQTGDCTPAGPTDCADDGDPCTVAQCDPVAGCVEIAASDGTPCDDGSACTGVGPGGAPLDPPFGDACAAGTCSGSPAPCEPDGPCSTAICDAALGCLQSDLPDGIACDDGDSCTNDTACAAGECVGGAQVVCTQPPSPCLVSTCSPATGNCLTGPAETGSSCDDGDPCTSGDSCENGSCAAGGPFDCGVPPDGCVVLECVAATGGCEPTVLADGDPCDEENPCRTSGTCTAGQCSSEPLVLCADPGEPCVIGVCDAGTGDCVDAPAPDGTACDDGQPCTTASACLSDTCSGGAPVECPDDGDTCTLELCEPGVGCSFAAAEEGIPCDDGSQCTDGGTCQGGQCASGDPIPCPADGDSCTSDACVDGEGCVYPALEDETPCDDGSACTGPDLCEAGGCEGAPIVTCGDSGDPCMPLACEAATGDCVETPAEDGTDCDDENVCTLGDGCVAGECAGTPVSCPEDGDPCTASICDPGPGVCVQTSSDAGTECDDGDVCTVTDVCDGAGSCGGAPKPCPEGEEPCLEPSCDPISGDCSVVQSPNGAPCEDDQLCETGDFCLQGDCAPGIAPACIPSSACVTVSCDPATGDCTESPVGNGASCDDLDACSTGETCQGGVCAGGTPTVCPGGSECQVGSCDPDSGQCQLTGVADGTQCDDSDPCTADDVCAGDACAGATLQCPAGPDPCVQSSCDPGQGGCVEANLADGAPCDDGAVCTDSDVCAGGVCAGSPAQCPPSASECQVSVCTPGIGCTGKDANEGATCNDDPCTVDGSCTGGVCVGGTPLVCTDPGVACLVASCDSETGCDSAPEADGAACDDGNACTTSTSCTAGSCTGNALECPEPPDCQAAVCDPAVGCTTVDQADGAPCDDADPCTVGDSCVAGGCSSGAPVVCGGTACEPEICDGQTGLCVTTTAPNGTDCDDGNACTGVGPGGEPLEPPFGDSCTAGACGAGDVLTCADPVDPCLDAACSPALGGCIQVPAPDGTPCDDASLCTDGDQCAGGGCAGSLTVICPAPDGCAYKQCDPTTGACGPLTAPADAPCDDGEACQVGESCDAVGQCVAGPAATQCCADATDCDDGTPCTADSCSAGRCVHAAEDLEACVTRIVVARPGDAEGSILDDSLAVVGTFEVPGTLRHLASDSAGSLVVGAVAAAAGVFAVDPLQPTELTPAPSTSAASWVAVDGELGLIVVVLEDGSVSTWDSGTGDAVASGISVPTPTGSPALEPETHRLLLPAGDGFVGVIDLSPLGAPPTTPWFVGGAPTAAAYDPTLERLFLADGQSGGVRVVSALHGAGLAGDGSIAGGTPAALAVDPEEGHLLATHPSLDVLRGFDLATLQPLSPPAVALIAPTGLAVDREGGRVYVTEATNDGTLHALDRTTLSVVDTVTDLGGNPDHVVVVRSRPGPIVITEAMADPTEVSDANGEWIELHNPGTAAVSLDGWLVQTESAFEIIDDPSLAVPAQGFVVLCRNDDLATNGGVTCDYDYDGLPLVNSGTRLFLDDAAGARVDDANLTGAISAGETLALRHTAYNNARRYSWSFSSGTPGAPNSDVADSL